MKLSCEDEIQCYENAISCLCQGQDPASLHYANIVCGVDVAAEPTQTLPDVETVDAALQFLRQSQRQRHNDDERNEQEWEKRQGLLHFLFFIRT